MNLAQSVNESKVSWCHGGNKKKTLLGMWNFQLQPRSYRKLESMRFLTERRAFLKFLVTGKTMQEGSDGRAGLDSAGISLI